MAVSDAEQAFIVSMDKFARNGNARLAAAGLSGAMWSRRLSVATEELARWGLLTADEAREMVRRDVNPFEAKTNPLSGLCVFRTYHWKAPQTIKYPVHEALFLGTVYDVSMLRLALQYGDLPAGAFDPATHSDIAQPQGLEAQLKAWGDRLATAIALSQFQEQIASGWGLPSAPAGQHLRMFNSSGSVVAVGMVDLVTAAKTWAQGQKKGLISRLFGR